MKRYFLLLLLPLFLTDCGKNDVILFNMPYRAEFEIDAGLNPFDAHFYSERDIMTNADELFDVHNADINEIQVINPHTARLSAIFSDAEYDFIRNVSVRIFKDDPDDYLEIFFRDDVPLNTNFDIDLVPTLVDVKEYIKEETFNVVTRFELRSSSPEFIQTRIDFSFDVK